jgi:hypothetical protein
MQKLSGAADADSSSGGASVLTPSSSSGGQQSAAAAAQDRAHCVLTTYSQTERAKEHRSSSV